MTTAMEFRTDGLVIILEDEKKLLKGLFERHPEFAEKFTSEVNIPIFTNDELVSFGKTYAFDEDYKIDNMATLALYNRIGELQTPEHPVTVTDVKEIIDKAIRHSERFGFRKLGMILSKNGMTRTTGLYFMRKTLRCSCSLRNCRAWIATNRLIRYIWRSCRSKVAPFFVGVERQEGGKWVLRLLYRVAGTY